jgi:hypothetical protein
MVIFSVRDLAFSMRPTPDRRKEPLEERVDLVLWLRVSLSEPATQESQIVANKVSQVFSHCEAILLVNYEARWRP